jgi:hypothetical protein
MDAHLDETIDQLRHLTTSQLRSKYLELFGQPSHSHHKGYLFRRLAWRLQAFAQGGLSEHARRYAQQIAQEADLRLCPPNQSLPAQPLRITASPPRDPRVPAPGTVLAKRYKNDVITVTVLEHGFQYGEQVYKSLSCIARVVTGTQWNGYSFFGLSSPKGRRGASQ